MLKDRVKYFSERRSWKYGVSDKILHMSSTPQKGAKCKLHVTGTGDSAPEVAGIS